MRPLRKSTRNQPERELQNGWLTWFRAHGWYVIEMNASAVLSGLPDLFTTHTEHGFRWVEVKLPGMVGSKFTPAQNKRFPEIVNNGTPIWILTEVTQNEYNKLFSQPAGNFMEYYLMKGF